MIHRHLLAFGLLVLLFPAVLPPLVTVLGGVSFGLGFWFWLPHLLVHKAMFGLWRKGFVVRRNGRWELKGRE